ncbi:MAG: epoxyqueuosine reductase QueH [Eubacterium sp.]|nr:epoxyqueuosine reductase QueH [Eubacterium sp.]
MTSNKRNYQKELEKLISELDGKKTLLLHCCCGPCSTYVTEYLHRFFDITIFFYNPNITEEDEYLKRKEELMRYYSEVSYGREICFIDADYEPEKFFEVSKGLENEPERGKRCLKCFELRLGATAEVAKNEGFDYFCSSLSISPYKNAEDLMMVGEKMSEKFGVPYLVSDFKKNNGYKRSIELSEEYGLYRQNFCGCIFSK